MDRRRLLLVVAVLVAALGAGLVFVYAQGAEDRAAEQVDTRQVLVVLQTISPGESSANLYSDGKVDVREVPADQLLEGSTDDGAAFDDTVALTTLYPGEQLLTQKFGDIEDIEGRPTLPLPAGKTAITLQMTNATRVTSFTQPGSHVAIYTDAFSTSVQQGPVPDGTTVPGTTLVGGPSEPACVIESDVLVLGVGSTAVDQSGTPVADGGEEGTDDQLQEDVVGTTYLTVAVDSRQAARLIPFQLNQERNPSAPILSFALRNDSSDVRNTEGCAEFLESFDQRLELTGRRNG